MKVEVSTRRVQLKSSIQRLWMPPHNMIGQNPRDHYLRGFPISIRKRERGVRKTTVVKTNETFSSLVILSTRTSYPSDEGIYKEAPTPPH